MRIDLTMPIEESMASHPFHGRAPVFLSGTLKHDRLYPSTNRRNPYDNSVLSFQNELIVVCGHTGTHMDAPIHADPKGIDVREMSLDYGMGEAVWLDVSSRFGDANEVSADDLRKAEREGGEEIKKGDILLIWTGWSTTLPDNVRYLSRHMGLTKEAAEWVREKGVRTLGIDTTTPETVEGSFSSPVHMNFLKPTSLGLNSSDVIAIIENLININTIPARRFMFHGLPLPFVGQSGSPIRALATL